MSVTVVGGSQHALGLNVYCAIIDEANFGQGRRSVRKHKNEMLLIAEVACSPREVRKILLAQAEKIIANLSQWDSPTRKQLERELYKFCDRHYYADFQRKKTVESVAKRAMRRWSHARYKHLWH